MNNLIPSGGAQKVTSKKLVIFIILVILLIASFVIIKMDSSTRVKLETNHGDIVINLYS